MLHTPTHFQRRAVVFVVETSIFVNLSRYTETNI